MANTADTPNIHLAYSDDADINRNWEILDSTIRALGLRQIIPDNVLIQGDLEVTGNALIDGALQVNGQSSLAMLNVSQTATFTGSTNIDGPLVVPVGPITLPPGSIDGAALVPGVAVRGVWIGTAIGTATTITGTPVKLAEVLTSAQEDPNRWSLVLAQVTMTVRFGAAGGAPIADLDLDLHRGTTVVQTRELFYDATTMGAVAGLELDIPVTVVRIAKPGDTANAWSIWGSGSLSGGASCYCSFAQLHTIQLA